MHFTMFTIAHDVYTNNVNIKLEEVSRQLLLLHSLVSIMYKELDRIWIRKHLSTIAMY